MDLHEMDRKHPLQLVTDKTQKDFQAGGHRQTHGQMDG